MEEEERKPTIENPFAPKAKERPFAVPKHIQQQREAAAAPKLYQPPYFISQASKNFIAKQIENGILTSAELENIFKIANIISGIFKRNIPTYSDIEIAIIFRTIEHARQVASGEIEMDLKRNDTKTLEVMPRKERIKFWQMVAELLVEKYDQLPSEIPSA